MGLETLFNASVAVVAVFSLAALCRLLLLILRGVKGRVRADEVTTRLLRFALHNSGLPNVKIKPDSIENENANNARYLMKSKKDNEKIAGKMLIKFMANDGNEVAEVVLDIAEEVSKTNLKSAKKEAVLLKSANFANKNSSSNLVSSVKLKFF